METKIFKAFTCFLASCVFLLSIGCFLLVGCSRSVSELQEEFSGYPIVKRDGCEYIACKTYGEFIIYVHKGNCSNPIHMYNIEKPIPILRDNNAIREKALSKLTKEEKEVLGIKE